MQAADLATFRGRGRIDGTFIETALLASLLIHAAAIFWLRIPDPGTPAPAEVLRVQLRVPPAAVAQPQVSPPAAPEVTDGVATPSAPAPAGPPAEHRDWAAQAEAVIASMGGSRRSIYTAPPTGNPAVSSPAPSAVRGLEDAFRPLNRLTETCGKIVEFKFGIHDISMPVAYPCADKQEEARGPRDAGPKPAGGKAGAE